MGGLVARSMLEDMCVQFEQDKNKFTLKEFPKKSVNGKIEQFEKQSSPCTNPFNSYAPIKVNKFITIGTPQRGAPKSFSLWETGDVGLTDGSAFDFVVKSQLIGLAATNQDLFNVIHGYNPQIPNGIV